MDLYRKYGKYVLLVSFLILSVFVVIYATKKDNNNDTQVENNISPTPIAVSNTPTVTPVEEHTGEIRSRLTGLWVPEEVANSRPYAVMLNNIKIASPQSGTKDAVILYEALVEGGITRLMGIYENIDLASETAKRIGSVRSARHYYVSFADAYDAIFIHFGKTTYADKKMKKLEIDHLDGNYGVGSSAFYRDKTIKAPHNAFASLEGITSVIKKSEFRTTYETNSRGCLTFSLEDTNLISDLMVNKLTLKFSSYTSPYFIYNTSTKEFERYQFEKPHIDANTSKVLSYKNIIIQFVKQWDIDKNGYQTMDIENAEGEGFYITNAAAVPITWSKNESTGFMRYYNSDGNELELNPGKTYIAVFPNSKTENVIFE